MECPFHVSSDIWSLLTRDINSLAIWIFLSKSKQEEFLEELMQLEREFHLYKESCWILREPIQNRKGIIIGWYLEGKGEYLF